MVGRALAPVVLHPRQNGGVNLERVYSFKTRKQVTVYHPFVLLLEYDGEDFQTLRQGTLISVLQPERSWYDLTAFRQLALPQADFHKKVRHEPQSREKLK